MKLKYSYLWKSGDLEKLEEIANKYKIPLDVIETGVMLDKDLDETDINSYYYLLLKVIKTQIEDSVSKYIMKPFNYEPTIYVEGLDSCIDDELYLNDVVLPSAIDKVALENYLKERQDG